MTRERHTTFFPREAQAIADARAWACKVAEGFPRLYDLSLVVSELGTNAQVHGGGEMFGVLLDVEADSVRVCVTDEGTGGMPHLTPMDGELHVGGLGLYLVEDLAASLTFDRVADLTIVTALLTAEATTPRDEDGAAVNAPEPPEQPEPSATARIPERGRVAWLLRPAARDVRRLYDEALRPVGLTFEEYLILDAVRALEPTNAITVTRLLHMPDRTGDNLFNGLERRGMLQRRRVKGWGPSRANAVTAVGHAVHAAASRHVDRLDALVADALPDDVDTVVAALEALTAAASTATSAPA